MGSLLRLWREDPKMPKYKVTRLFTTWTRDVVEAPTPEAAKEAVVGRIPFSVLGALRHDLKANLELSDSFVEIAEKPTGVDG